jgi:hypothetical protein
MVNKIKALMEGNEDVLKIPVVGKLIALMEEQNREIEALKAEIKRLKKQPAKPKIKPSTLEKPAKGITDTKSGKGEGRVKCAKKPYLKIDKEEKIKAQDVPAGSVFKGYKEVIIQDIEIRPENTLYLLETWRTAEGKYIYGQLPASLQGGDFGPGIKSFILYQCYQCHVTQPLLHEQLREFGINISTGQVSRILTENKEAFHEEHAGILQAGLQSASYIQCDDTGARHQGKNGYCTFIGNNFFSYFKSTESKSRINFLELLLGDIIEYLVNEEALDYMKKQKMSSGDLASLASPGGVFASKDAWNKYLMQSGVTLPYAIRIATEGALMGSLMARVNKDLTVISDDAGQFNVFQHGLCWVHAERNIQKLECYNPEQEKELKSITTAFWQLYQDLKAYQKAPEQNKIKVLEDAFDAICQTNTSWGALEKALTKLAANKNELLLVLKRPEIPLHNNASERDIREYVKKRKISGSTRSETGRRCRDAFTSLKKTCRKLNISFWQFLNDRISLSNTIEQLPTLIQKAMCANPHNGIAYL